MSLRTFVLLGVVMALFSSDGARAQITPPPGSSICALSGSQTTGYVLTATNGGTACAWQTAGGASVDNNTLKNAAFIQDLSVSANTITGTTATAFPGAYAKGQSIIVQVANTNTGATTININTLGAKAVTKNGNTALAAGNLVAGNDYLMTYDGTEFEVLTFTILAVDIPTLNQNTTGNAATATNLASYPTLCSGGQFSQGLSSGSNNCGTPAGGGGTTIWTGSGDPNGTTSDVAPHNMTTDSSPVPYVASASGEAAPNLAYCAFSSSCLNNVWQSNLNPTYPTWLEMDLGSGNAVILKNYSLQTNLYGAYMPYNFQMQGSNDNSTWTTVDTRSAITFSNNTTQNFVCATQTTPYRYFRVLTSTSPTPAYTIIAQVYLFASNPFTSGAAGDFFYSVSLDQFFGPRTSGATPSWPAQSLPNFSGVISNGSTFTASGCSNSTLVGGATAGSFKSGTTGTCTVVITPGITAPHGWACKASDLTTSADLVTQTATTTSTFTLSGITVSADVVNFSCTGY